MFFLNIKQLKSTASGISWSNLTHTNAVVIVYFCIPKAKIHHTTLLNVTGCLHVPHKTIFCLLLNSYFVVFHVHRIYQWAAFWFVHWKQAFSVVFKVASNMQIVACNYMYIWDFRIELYTNQYFTDCHMQKSCITYVGPNSWSMAQQYMRRWSCLQIRTKIRFQDKLSEKKCCSKNRLWSVLYML